MTDSLTKFSDDKVNILCAACGGIVAGPEGAPNTPWRKTGETETHERVELLCAHCGAVIGRTENKKERFEWLAPIVQQRVAEAARNHVGPYRAFEHEARLIYQRKLEAVEALLAASVELGYRYARVELSRGGDTRDGRWHETSTIVDGNGDQLAEVSLRDAGDGIVKLEVSTGDDFEMRLRSTGRYQVIWDLTMRPLTE